MTIEEVIRQALNEDIGSGDHTSLSTIPESAYGKARLLVKEEGIIAGVEIAIKVFNQVDPGIIVDVRIKDGTMVKPGDVVFYVEGKSSALLTAERTVLNFMQRMSGIATQTRRIVGIIEGFPTKVLDTRKTTPLLREIEKLAVRIGGGFNHRFGLYDMILIKDNHVDFAGGIEPAIHSARTYLEKNNLGLKVEIEARNLEEVRQIIQYGGVDRVMLDNFTYDELKKAVELIQGRFETEASGGITEKTVKDFAECGVDYVSIGYITHHISSLDMSLKAVKQ